MTDITTVSVRDTFGFWAGRLNDVIGRVNYSILDASGRVNISSGSIAGVSISSSSISGSSGTFTTLSITTPLGLTSGGTGASTAAGARTALGLGSMATQNQDAVNITGGTISALSSPLPIAAGGTGGASAAAARTALGLGDMATQNASAVAITAGNIGTGVNVGGVLGGSIWTTGDAKLTFKTSADSGWVFANDGTIGSAGSGATTRANADTLSLYTLLWNTISDTWCPVSGGRGVSAAADFAANKTIRLPRLLGRAIAIAGAGAGLTSRTLGEYLGTETHTITVAEMPAHSHTYYTGTGESTVMSGKPANAQSGAVYQTLSTESAGSGSAHNNMQPTSFMNLMIKL